MLLTLSPHVPNNHGRERRSLMRTGKLGTIHLFCLRHIDTQYLPLPLRKPPHFSLSNVTQPKLALRGRSVGRLLVFTHPQVAPSSPRTDSKQPAPPSGRIEDLPPAEPLPPPKESVSDEERYPLPCPHRLHLPHPHSLPKTRISTCCAHPSHRLLSPNLAVSLVCLVPCVLPLIVEAAAGAAAVAPRRHTF